MKKSLRTATLDKPRYSCWICSVNPENEDLQVRSIPDGAKARKIAFAFTTKTGGRPVILARTRGEAVDVWLSYQAGRTSPWTIKRGDLEGACNALADCLVIGGHK